MRTGYRPVCPPSLAWWLMSPVAVCRTVLSVGEGGTVRHSVWAPFSASAAAAPVAAQTPDGAQEVWDVTMTPFEEGGTLGTASP